MHSGLRDHSAVVAALLVAPWGPVCVAATARGIVAVELMSSREAFASDLERRLGRPVTWVQPALEQEGMTDLDPVALGHLRAAAAAIEMAAVGDGDIADRFATLPLDLEDRPAWDREVLAVVRAIPHGETRSYGDIARAIGRPGAARAVGGAVGRNPVGYVIPCHRVIAADGTLGGYGGGWWGDQERLLDLKAELLAQEGLTVRRSASAPRRGR